MRILKYKDALSEATVQSMAIDKNIFITGIAVDYPSGIFGTTVEAARRFPDRVFDAPAMENALTGIAIGAAAVGKRPIIVHPRNDFMFLALDQLINLAAKWRYMYGGNAGSLPIVTRAVIGRGWGQGATHSQSLHSILAHFPGLNVIMPAFPDDAKGLMAQALRGNSPTIILEHRSLFDTEGHVPEELTPIEFGKARVLKKGTDLTIVASSFMAYEALHAAEELERYGLSVEVIDPRTIRPLDREAIIQSVAKTGRLIVSDVSWDFCGFSAEVSAMVAEQAFEHLKAPIKRICMADCPAPVSSVLEASFYPRASTLAKAVVQMLDRHDIPEFAIDRNDNFKGPY
jgi:pyruvate dehydrogenase E1 component beta subunit